jgi:glycosyltransferase involved in cell wall biosynthesis
MCGVPVVVHTFHGHVFHGYFPRPVSWGFMTIERALARGTGRIVTISPRQFADITERYRIVAPECASMIPLGFELSQFASVPALRGRLRSELGLGDEPVISSVGRLTPIKDHPLLFQAFRRLDNPRAHLCIVGGGESEGALRTLANQLGIVDRTHFLGFRSDLEVVLADTDVVALTSHNEGTPVALIEALAAGCTPVALSVGGVADVLEDGKWGILVGQRSPEALAEALRGAIERHRGRPTEVVENAGSYVRGKYGIGRLVADHEALYRRLVAANGTSRPRNGVGT